MELHLVLAEEAESSGSTELLAGRGWRLSNDAATPGAHHRTPYHCISYTWGSERSPNLFRQPGEVSSRTRAALEAAILTCPADSAERHAFWIDAVCVPSAGVARRATLESMGYIYAQAESVVVVLQSATYGMISRNARSREAYSEEEMRILNDDKWIDSVWTYEELVNAKEFFFTTTGLPSGTRMKGEDLFNGVGLSLERYKTLHALSELQIRQQFPALHAMEDALADRMLGGYLQRSMLTCLAGVANRYCDPAWPANRLYALLGTLTQEPSWGAVDETVAQLTEKAMRICEEKGDFSYIYTTEKRELAARRWRPLPSDGLSPVLRWHGWGERQPGKLFPEGRLELQEMVRLDLQVLPSSNALSSIQRWLAGMTGSSEDELTATGEIEEQLPRILSEVGFKGSNICHRCRTGLIFAHDVIHDGESLEAYASGSVQWTFGAPGIGTVLDGARRVLRYTVLVHVGEPLLREPKGSILLA